MPGYIGISREITDHWIYKDADHFKIWFEMLHRARYVKEPKTDYIDGYLVTLEYAQFVFGRVSWSSRLKVGEQKLRTLIKKLIAEQMIERVKDYPKFTVYFIKNYEKYNHQETLQNKGIEDYTNQQPTSSQPAANQQLTTYKQGNKDNKDKKVLKDISGASPQIHKFTPPALEDVKAYCLERNNSVDSEKWFDFYESKGWMVGKNKMKDWKAAVRTWEHGDKSLKSKADEKREAYEKAREEANRMLKEEGIQFDEE